MIIIKYFEWLRLFKDIRYPIYELCKKDYSCKKQLSREEAMRLVRKHNLKKVYEDKYGTIWES